MRRVAKVFCGWTAFAQRAGVGGFKGLMWQTLSWRLVCRYDTCNNYGGDEPPSPWAASSGFL
eukprot:5461342-Amphidinium_carterae.1